MKNKIRPSVILWNSLVFLTVVVIAVINLEAAGCIVAIMSFGAIAVLLEEGLDLHKKNKEFVHYWVVLTPLVWILTVIGALLFLGVWTKEHIFDTISDKIDEKFSK
jgi:hypothetical protein